MYDTEIKNSRLVDCRGLQCPLPILQTRLALNQCQSGDQLTILADDPTFEKDFLQFCQLASITCLLRTHHETYTQYDCRVD